METNNLSSWEAFEDVVRQNNIETEGLRESKQTISSTSPIIYRGQADSSWELKSDLERKVQKNITVDSYLNIMLKIWNTHKNNYENKWPELENEIKGLNVDCIYSFPTARANSMQIISFMAHLRHHGFFSPLLDWTENPLIAAFFAFENITDNTERIAIYTFREHTGYMPDMSDMSEPTAMEIGNNIPGIERHKNQESHYTLCTQQEGINNFKNAVFVNMEKDIDKSGFCTDSNGDEIDLSSVRNVTRKYTIPVSERNEVLKKSTPPKSFSSNLHLYNLYAAIHILLRQEVCRFAFYSTLELIIQELSNKAVTELLSSLFCSLFFSFSTKSI